MALAQNPALRAQIERHREVLGGVAEVRADAFPQLDLVASWGRSRNPTFLNSPDFDDLIGQFPDFQPGEQELWDLGLEVNQTLYSGGKVQAAIDLAELVVEVDDAQTRTVILDTALAAAELHYELLAARRSAAAVESQRRAREESLGVLQARYDLGDATELERLRAVASLQAVAPALARAEGRIEVVSSRLRALLGLGRSVPLDVVDVPVIDADTLASEAFDHPEPAALVALAAARRPELEDLDLQDKVLGRRVEVTAAEASPQLELNGRYAHQVRLLDDLDDDLFADWRVSINMTWNLFDGGRRKGLLAQLDSQRQQLHWTRQDLENTVVAEISEALATARTLAEEYRAAAVSARTAREASRVAEESYREGVALQVDVLAARDQVIQAELEEIDALYRALTNAAQLRRAVGLLPTEDWPTEDRPSENRPTEDPAMESRNDDD